jgi:hypothetical protein
MKTISEIIRLIEKKMNGPNTTDLWLLIFYPKKMKIIKNKTKQKSKEKNVM